MSKENEENLAEDIANAILAEVQRNKAASYTAAVKETESIFNISIPKVEKMLTAPIDPSSADKMFRSAVKHHLNCLGYIVELREKMASGWSLEGFDRWWKSDEWNMLQGEE